MRAFVALEVSDEKVLDALVALQSELAGSGADLKLVERPNLHFTMKFLGEISDAEAKDADSRLRSLRLKGGEVLVAGVGAFPSPHRPNVVWVGVADSDKPKVQIIAEAVIGALEGIGERDSRPFQAHLTLARVRSQRNAGALSSKLAAVSDRAIGRIRLSSFALKSSVLTPRGPTYSDIGVYDLA